MELWTIEELCFYLYYNIENLDETVMGRELYEWLAKEIRLPRLSSSLEQEQKQGKSVPWCAWFLLKEIGMYSDEELEEIRTFCFAMENKDAFECQKLKADRLLQNGKYLRSIQEYEKLLALGEENRQYQHLTGDILHNMGVANTRLFLFQEAADCFEKAYARNHREESLKAQKEALKQADAQEIPAAVQPEEMDWAECLRKLREDYKKKVK